MGRPLEFDKNEALDIAMELFWLKGYEATSMKDLLTAMNLSKSSFYQSFGKKSTLFQNTIIRYRQRLTSEMQASLAHAVSGRQFIESMFDVFVNSNNDLERQRGCFVMNCASEFAQRNAEVTELVSGGLKQFEAVFRQAILRCMAEGTIPSNMDPQALASYLVSSRSGLKTMAKAGVDQETLNSIVNTVYSTLGW